METRARGMLCAGVRSQAGGLGVCPRGPSPWVGGGRPARPAIPLCGPLTPCLSSVCLQVTGRPMSHRRVLGASTGPQPTSSFQVRNGRLREGRDSGEVTQQIRLTTRRPQFLLRPATSPARRAGTWERGWVLGGGVHARGRVAARGCPRKLPAATRCCPTGRPPVTRAIGPTGEVSRGTEEWHFCFHAI